MDQRALSTATRRPRNHAAGSVWIEAEAQERFGKEFPALSGAQLKAIADDICSAAQAKPGFAAAAKFFAKFRDLTAGGFYTTPVGMKDIGYTGNVPLDKFDGPPLEVFEKGRPGLSHSIEDELPALPPAGAGRDSCGELSRCHGSIAARWRVHQVCPCW